MEAGWNGAHVWTTLHLGLDEPKQMLLVHAARVMHVGINFADVVEISGGGRIRHAMRALGGTYL